MAPKRAQGCRPLRRWLQAPGRQLFWRLQPWSWPRPAARRRRLIREPVPLFFADSRTWAAIVTIVLMGQMFSCTIPRQIRCYSGLGDRLKRPVGPTSHPFPTEFGKKNAGLFRRISAFDPPHITVHIGAEVDSGNITHCKPELQAIPGRLPTVFFVTTGATSRHPPRLSLLNRFFQAPSSNYPNFSGNP